MADILDLSPFSLPCLADCHAEGTEEDRREEVMTLVRC